MHEQQQPQQQLASADAPDQRHRVEQARALMMSFADRTGVASAERPQQRYLWTDAFAVCNFIGLARATGEERYLHLAVELVDRVHHTLGRSRSRSGWISGLGETEGEERPTRGGLRIGKKLPERGAGEPVDERLEWDRDGQYFHYLTKWMHALDLLARTTGDVRFHKWSRDLAVVSHDAFTYSLPGAGRGPSSRGGRAMYWKMSVDLSRPLVRSMGHHDPLDGLITYTQIQETARAFSQPGLEDEIASFTSMIEGRDLTTTDPLGLGGLLTDAYRLDQLAHRSASAFTDRELRERLLDAALAGLQGFVRGTDLEEPPAHRLAFREFGLAIGLSMVDRMQVKALARFVPLRSSIEATWLEPRNRQLGSWLEHRDINEVMLATSLVPDGCTTLPPPDRRTR